MIAFLSIDGMNSKSKRQPRTRTKLRGGGQFSQAAALYQFLGMLQTPRIMAAEASSDRKSHLKKKILKLEIIVGEMSTSERAKVLTFVCKTD